MGYEDRNQFQVWNSKICNFDFMQDLVIDMLMTNKQETS